MGSAHESASSSTVALSEGLNVSVFAGTVHQPPQWRELPNGESVTTFDIKVRGETGRSEIIRASWMAAPTSALELEEGDNVLVVGRVRSYWSGKRSETDVLASTIIRSKSVGKVRRALGGSMAALQTACP